MADAPWLVVGLGNPGPDYEGTRHNVGRMVLDVLAGRSGGRFRHAGRVRAAVCECRIGTGPGGVPGPRAVLAQPESYMNLSGGPVAGLARFYSVPRDRVVVVHDELDLPPGTLRLKLGGGDNGHNGLKDITKALGGPGYHRVRVGIGRPPGRTSPADHVLRRFSTAERRDLPVTLELAADAVECLVTEGLDAARNRFNS